jgi:hypothetical protein
MRSLRMQILISHLIMVLLVGVLMSAAVSNIFALGRGIDRILQANFRSIIACGRMRTAAAAEHASVSLFLAGQQEEARRRFLTTRPDFEQGWNDALDAVNQPGE